MKIVFSGECLEYKFGGHPESPERVKRIQEFLKHKGFRFTRPEPCSEGDLLLVHSGEMVERIKKEDFMDFETPAMPGIYHYARLSAGGALMAMKIALDGENAFSLMRPPGHHASRDNYGGFCYFNNMAVAVSRALEKIGKVAVLDIDVHHGNGSESIFMGKKNVLYTSLHQFGFIYPGTGRESRENIFNFPLERGTSEGEYLEKLKEAIEMIGKFSPDLIGVSVGFDTFKDDPLAGLNLDVGTYKKIGEMIRGLGMPSFSVLEGGYSEKIPQCVYSYLTGLS